MYCSKCGKEIDYDTLVCRECAQAVPADATSRGRNNPRMRGFGEALKGCIVGFAAIVISVVVYFLGIIVVLRAYGFVEDITHMAMIVLFFEVQAIIPAIIAIVEGARSVQLFRATPKALPKPIATLIVGIHAIFFGVFALLYSGIFSYIVLTLLLTPV